MTMAAMLLAGVLTGCREAAPRYRIGLSQCLDDAWRQRMNDEMQRELIYHPDIEIITRTAYGSNELQCAQIDSLIADKIDLLIVSPNEAEAVKPAVSRAYRAGIPVVIADRRVTGEEWTAFIGGDNYSVGKLMAEWLADQAQQHPIHVLEVAGLPGSTPATLRHQGMMEHLHMLHHKGVEVSTVIGNWMQDSARIAVRNYLAEHDDVVAIVAQNDLMAVGASEAVRQSRYVAGSVRIMGVDGLELGLRAIEHGEIECTATYLSRGDLIIQTAMQILEGRPYLREINLATTMIDRESVHAVLLGEGARKHDHETIAYMQEQMQDFMVRYQARIMGLYMLLMMAFVILIAGLIYLVMLQRKLRMEVKDAIFSVAEEAMSQERDNTFVTRLLAVIDAHLGDSELDIDMLSREMCISRTQLFRKTKAATGKAAIDIIRERRLSKARELLQTTDYTIQQVAYEVGFTSPSYFTKCYKKQYGEQPKRR